MSGNIWQDLTDKTHSIRTAELLIEARLAQATNEPDPLAMIKLDNALGRAKIHMQIAVRHAQNLTPEGTKP